MESNNLLPVGTVVKLQYVDQLAMVYGYYQRDIDTKKIYDYVGTIYPLGVRKGGNDIVFNKDAIEKIHFIGYDTDIYRKYEEEIRNKREEVE